MDKRLAHALDLRKQKKYIEVNQILLGLVKEKPEDAYLNYQCAWSFDNLGEENAAIYYYEKATQGDLTRNDLENAYLGLGST